MNRLHTLFAHKKHPLRLRLLCTGLCCAFLFAGGYYAARHLLNAYWPSLGAAFADNGLTLRAFCAAAAAVLPAAGLRRLLHGGRGPGAPGPTAGGQRFLPAVCRLCSGHRVPPLEAQCVVRVG